MTHFIAKPISARAAGLSFASAIALTAVLESAAAQAPSAEDELTDEIIVSARRRDESLQDVPVAVSAFSGDQLNAIGAIDLTDIEAITPNVTLETSRGTNNTITAFIRGVGQQDPVAGFEAGVGLYIDDVYLNRPQAALLDIYEVERIEVLRGPQGTLYGRNTIGGAVKYVTKGLADEPEVNLRLQGGTFGQLDAIGSFSLPLLTDSSIGDLKIGGTVAYLRRNGFGDNLNIPDLENYNKDILAGRVAVEWDPTDTFSLRITGDWTDDNSDPRQGHRLLDFPGFPVLDNVFDTRSGLNAPEQSVVARGISATAEWRVSDTITLKNILAYRDDFTETPIDFDSLPIVDLDVPAIYDNSQFSEEFQVLYEGDRLSGVVGFYFLDANALNEFDVLLETTGALPVVGLPGLNAFTSSDVDTSTWSVFADFSYQLTDTVAISLGGRYTEDTRTISLDRQTFLNGSSPTFGGTPRDPIAVAADLNAEADFEDFSPRASISWQPLEEHNFYFSYAKGFKGGSFDPRCGANAAPDLDGDGATGATDVDDQIEFCRFEPEEIDTFEWGWKTSLDGGRFTTNTAIFYSDYQDVQIPGSIGIDADNDGVAESFAGVTTNAAAATLWGVEFEGNLGVARDWMRPGDSLDYQFALGYINASFDEFLGRTGEDISDQAVFQNTPEITAFSQLGYTTPTELFGDDGDFNIYSSFSYRSETSQFNFRSPIDQEGFVLFNAGLSWTREDGRLSVGVHGTNLLDKEYIVAGYDFVTAQPAFGNNPLGLSGVLTAFYGNPRQVFGTLSVSF
ncbi:MAG: TonB-dependent receptor [Pseudomonadota bacterium]